MLGLPDQPNLTIAGERGGYVFKPVSDLFRELRLRTKKFANWTEEETSQVMALYQECWDKFQKELSVVPSHHSVFVKEHISYLVDPARLSEFSFGLDGRRPVDLGVLRSPYCEEEQIVTKLRPSGSAINLTLLPEEFLQGWLPTFLIRHPALAFPSLYRALAELDPTANHGEDDEPLLGQQSMTLRWSRSMYEWYADRLGSGSSDTWPIVLDADDIMESPELVAKYCRLLGMDPEKLCFSWDPSTEDDAARFPRSRQRFQATLMASKGVQKDKIGTGIVLEKELDKWHEEFGPRVAQSLEKLVRDAMTDYEYLKSRRLCV
jgi:hypothetical protein